MTTIRELLERGPTLSFEFFPPKTVVAEQKLRETVDVVEKAEPDFVSVTYGAGGTTRETTRDTVIEMCADRTFPAMPHLTCVGHSYAEIHDLIDDYHAHGVHNVLALAGDPPEDGSPNPGDFRYALELVDTVREHTEMCVGVAAFPEIHPRSASRVMDRLHLSEKLNAADFGITQFFFHPEHYFRMVDELADLGCDLMRRRQHRAGLRHRVGDELRERDVLAGTRRLVALERRVHPNGSGIPQHHERRDDRRVHGEDHDEGDHAEQRVATHETDAPRRLERRPRQPARRRGHRRVQSAMVVTPLNRRSWSAPADAVNGPAPPATVVSLA